MTTKERRACPNVKSYRLPGREIAEQLIALRQGATPEEVMTRLIRRATTRD